MQNSKILYESDKIYEVLYENIINIKLEPGTLMSEKEISQKFNVSRTPVREAFIKLSNIGLVDIIPQRGTSVCKIDLKRVKEERFLREAIEIAVIAEFVKTCTESDIVEIEANIKKQELALKEQDYASFMNLDDEFHYLFFKLSNKKRCYEATRSFYGHYHRIRYMSMYITGVTSKLINQHKSIIEAIKTKDIEKTQEKLKDHLRKIMVEESQLKEKFPNYFLSKDEIIDYNTLF